MSMKSAEVSFREYSKVQREVNSRAETHIPAPSGHTDSISTIKKVIFLIFNIFIINDKHFPFSNTHNCQHGDLKPFATGGAQTDAGHSATYIILHQ